MTFRDSYPSAQTSRTGGPFLVDATLVGSGTIDETRLVY
jgi:hypothetical protein